jgi:hypothetical protein
MKKLCLLLFATLAVVAVSCKKETEEPAPVAKADYYQLKVGNYWIYQDFRIDSNGVETIRPDLDSAYIEKDTLIRGFTYFKLHEKMSGIAQMTLYLRDSSGYLVDNNGLILASDNNFADTLRINNTTPSLCTGYFTMIGKDSLVTIPAGTFQSITASQEVVPTPPNSGNFPVRYSYDCYGKGVGKIKSHVFLYSGIMSFEARLLRYMVQ